MKDKIIDNWHHAHRLSRSVFVAAILLVLLIYTWWNWPAALVSRSAQQATVISSVADGVMIVELKDGMRARLFTPKPVPLPGETIPVVLEIYEDGSTYVVIDPKKWFLRKL